MRVKNITPDPLSVPALARIVQPGETVDVPDVQDGAVLVCRHCGAVEDGHPGAQDAGHKFESDDSHRLTWPPGMWEPVKDRAAAKAKTEGGE